MADVLWGHAESEEAEGWSGAFATREECVEDGRDTYEGDFWVVSGARVDVAEYFPNAEWILEDAGERAYDIIGEVAEDFPDVSEDAVKELDALIAAWVAKHLPTLSFYAADGPRERIPNPKVAT